MENKKVYYCPYCSAEISPYSKFCSKCSARIPDHFWSSVTMQEESSENAADTSADEGSDFEIPKPGDLIGALAARIEAIAEGTEDAAPLMSALPSMKEQVGLVFRDIYAGLEVLPEDAADYRMALERILNYVCRLFEMALSEMELYGEDGDIEHLLFGRFLLQRSELEYIDILKTLKQQSRMDPFAGYRNIVAAWAGQLATGSLGREEFVSRMENLEQALLERIEQAQTLLQKGFETAKTYEGIEDAQMVAVMEKLAQAVELLSGVILNLYNPDETRDWVKEQVLETVNRMERDGELDAGAAEESE